MNISGTRRANDAAAAVKIATKFCLFHMHKAAGFFFSLQLRVKTHTFAAHKDQRSQVQEAPQLDAAGG